MIKVLIKRVENKPVSIMVKGHANSAPHGEDLVCAGVSAVVTGCFNSIEEVKNFKMELKEGLSYIEAIGKISAHDEVVLETLISSLMTIEESNSKFIKLEII